MRVSGWYLTSIWPVSEYLSTVLRLVQCFVRLSSAWRVSLLPRVALWRSRLLSVERWKQLESCRVSLNLIERIDASSTLNERHVLNGLKLRRLKPAGGFHMFESLCNNLLKHSAASHIERCMVTILWWADEKKTFSDELILSTFIFDFVLHFHRMFRVKASGWSKKKRSVV